jgi:hypothetical protein
MTKVWVLEDFEHGETDVYSEDTDILELPFVKTELGYLDGGYEDERDQFLADIQRAKERGYGEAYIEERFGLELKDLR